MSLERRSESMSAREFGSLPGVVMPSEGSDSGDEYMQPDDAIELLKSQHREVEQLFEEFDKAGERAHKAKESIAQKIIQKLEMHTQIEEKIFYPEVKRVDKDLVFEAYAEHNGAKDLIKRIKQTKPSDEMFKAQVCVLKEMIKHHVKEEEEDLFPQCEENIEPEDLMEMGEKMQQLMQTLESKQGSKKKASKATSKKSAGKSSTRAPARGKARA